MMFRRIGLLILVLVLLLAGQGWSAVLYAKTNGNLDDANMWATTKGGTIYKTLAEINADGTYILAANSYTIAVNQNVTALRLSTAVEGGDSTTGGGFTIGAAVTIAASTKSGSSACLATSNTYACTINGTVTAGIAGAPFGTLGITKGTAAVTINGSVYGGAGGGAYGIAGAANLTVNDGTLQAGTGDGQCQAIKTTGATGPTVNRCNIINVTQCSAISGPILYNPDPTNYIRYPKTSGTQDYYYDVPTAANTLTTDTTAGVTGLYHAPDREEVLYGATVGTTTGLLTLPNNGSAPYTFDASKMLTTGYCGPSTSLTQGTGTGGIAAENIIDAKWVFIGHRTYSPNGPWGKFMGKVGKTGGKQ